MNNLKQFCEIVKKRSEENSKSIKLLYEQKLYGNCISILRQELVWSEFYFYYHKNKKLGNF